MEPARAGGLLLFLLLLLLPALAAAAPGDFDPYRVLGVGRSSSQADIKKAYKRLAREWYVLPLRPLRPAPGAAPASARRQRRPRGGLSRLAPLRVLAGRRPAWHTEMLHAGDTRCKTLRRLAAGGEVRSQSA